MFGLAAARKMKFFARMIFSRRMYLAVLLTSTTTLWTAPARNTPPRPTETGDNTTAYKGAIVVDAASGNVLFEDRADYVGPPASVTKLMTFLLVHDRLARGDLTLQTPVIATAEAANT